MNNYFPDKNLIIILLLGHLIGDFIFQSNNVFKFKSKGLKGIIFHSLIVSLTTFGVLFVFYRSLFFTASASLLSFAFHFIIDLAKYKSSVEEAIKFILDQMAHLISIIIITVSLRNILTSEIMNLHLMKLSMFIIGMIMILYFLKYFTKSLYKVLDIDDESSKTYRFLETSERFMIFYFSYMHGFFFLLIPFAVIPRSIYAINNNKQHVFYDIILSMIMSSASGIILRKATLVNPFSHADFLLFSAGFFIIAFFFDRLFDFIVKLMQRDAVCS